MPTAEFLALTEEVGPLVLRVSRLWRREADRALSEHGLSEATALPLLTLARRGACVRQGILAEEMGLEGPSLVRLVDLLQTEGLIERRDDPGDRRAKILHLTPKGRARVAEIDGVLQRLRLQLLRDVSRDDLATTVETLRRIERRAAEAADGRERAA